MYRSDEAGLSSPAVVNDVVFVSTSKPALYALDATRGHCLWSAPSIPVGNPREPTFALGPAIYGNYVVMGAWNNVYIYRLPAAGMARRQETVDPGAELTLRLPPDPRILEFICGITNGT